MDTAIAQSQVTADEPRLIHVQEELRNENGQVRADQTKQNDALSFRPRACRQRRSAARQVHLKKVIAKRFKCRCRIRRDQPKICVKARPGFALSILARHKHPEPTFANAELDRTISHQFAVEFHRHRLIAVHA